MIGTASKAMIVSICVDEQTNHKKNSPTPNENVFLKL